jgi:hypothetical protein
VFKVKLKAKWQVVYGEESLTIPGGLISVGGSDGEAGAFWQINQGKLHQAPSRAEAKAAAEAWLFAQLEALLEFAVDMAPLLKHLTATSHLLEFGDPDEAECDDLDVIEAEAAGINYAVRQIVETFKTENNDASVT